MRWNKQNKESAGIKVSGSINLLVYLMVLSGIVVYSRGL